MLGKLGGLFKAQHFPPPTHTHTYKHTLQLLEPGGNASTVVSVTLAEHLHYSLLDHLLRVRHMAGNVVGEAGTLLLIQHVAVEITNLGRTERGVVKRCIATHTKGYGHRGRDKE